MYKNKIKNLIFSLRHIYYILTIINGFNLSYYIFKNKLYIDIYQSEEITIKVIMIIFCIFSLILMKKYDMKKYD